ncbi:MAG TPA: hypothetical protein VF066_03750, partial [Thermoleophilaceae bacterium]
MRTFEPLVPRAFGEQLAVERLLAMWADDHLRSHVPITRKPHFEFRRMGEDSLALPGHSECPISAAMRLDPNTHALVMATAFMTSICFAVAAMSVIGLT